jgi:diguanylate cyclase (GGDEF)-like protein/PAS domain S-box-containing protein
MKRNNTSYKLEYDELAEIFPCALYVIKESTIIDCNNAAVSMFGYKEKEDIIGLRPYDLSPDKQKDGSYSIIKGSEIIKSALNSEEDTLFKWIHKRKNGEIFLADIRIINKKGILYAIIMDSTEIDQLKRQLSEKDYVYRMLFENHNSMMLLIDPEAGSIIEANQAAISYYGYTKDKLLTMRIQDINILSQHQIEEEMNRAKTEKRSYFQFIHRLANNEQREVEVYSFPVETENGKLLFSIIHDVSDKLKQKLMFDTLFFDSPYAVAVLDKEQKIVNINRNFTYLFQYSLEDVEGQIINHLVSPKEKRIQVDNNIQLVYQGKIVKQEGLRRRKDGQKIEVEILCYPVINHQKVIGVYIIYIDVSHKKAYERELILFRKILENNTEGVVITDARGNVNWTNNAFSEITGYSLTEITGKKTNILNSGIHDQDFYKSMWDQLIYNGRWSGEIWNKNKKGDIYSEWLTISSIKVNSNKDTHYVGIFKDLSEKKKIDRRMNDLQQKDSLTGLYNRNYFLEIVDTYIRSSLEKNEKLAIIFVDLDGFKAINDSLGHVLGDRLLIELSKRLLFLMNDNHLLARFNGDEFAILYKSFIKESDVKNLSDMLLDSIQQPFIIENTILHITANIGISIFPGNATDAEVLVRYADIAMSKAKVQVGEKVCFYSEEMSKAIEEKFLLANHLVGAISNNELTIVYQPIVDIKKQKSIRGLEALLRWESPILGMVSPDKFIPLAEKTGQIIAIGEWVLEQVCKQINVWQSKGCHTVPIAVNISVKQLEQIEFVSIVTEMMRKNSIKSSDIELEITESVSSGDLITIVKNLKELKKNGIKISMDDFGTGFSSLGQLDLFELDKLKIDKIFIDDLVNVSKRQSLVKSIIAMARSLNLIVVAEGIETSEQLFYLKELGCQLGQGYLFSKPLQAEEIKTLLDLDKSYIPKIEIGGFK